MVSILMNETKTLHIDFNLSFFPRLLIHLLNGFADAKSLEAGEPRESLPINFTLERIIGTNRFKRMSHVIPTVPRHRMCFAQQT